tara:strand:+ start:887 stop:1621 length:735 start_codon:yes stop_codon:yes gene_type:complete
LENHTYKSYKVWDLPVRLFHWINVICVIGLGVLGTVILWSSAFGLSTDGKVLLKTVHVYFGYVFALNLIIRLGWAFAGNRFAGWRNLLPFEKGYTQKLKGQLAAEKSGQPKHYLGHTPAGRLAVSAMMVALIAMATSGIVLAGTDIYFPPFGAMFQEWVAAPGVDPATVAAYVKDNVDQAAFAEMRAFRKPFILVHYWTFFIVLALIVVHIAAVIYTEVKSGSTLISAIFTGRKVIPGEPEDKE